MKTKTLLFLMVAAISQACAIEDGAPTGDELDVESADSDGKADAPGSENYTYYTATRDIRRCAFPMCGGYWVERANRANLKCHDNRTAQRCYVAEIDWSATGLSPDQIDGARGAVQPMFRGTLQTRGYGDVGSFGVLQPSEVWAGNSELEPFGVFARITDSGIRCITTPCDSLHEAKLNASLEADISELDFWWSEATEDEISKAHDAIASSDGLLIAGYRYWYKERGTWTKGRDVTQFWRRIVPVASGGVVGDSCGSRGQVRCGEGLYCAYTEGDQCGWADAPGTCAVAPDGCIEIYQPVCGCDGLTYGNSCMASEASTSVLHAGACE